MNPHVLITLLGSLTITSYRAVPEQTTPTCKDRYHCTTSIGENVSELGCAISQDLLKSGKVHYHDIIIIDGFAPRIVDDTMNPRIHNSIDLFVYTKDEERRINVQHKRVWVIHPQGEKR
jgi:3D (Asp-Asp-Asp) domain-containing protein